MEVETLQTGMTCGADVKDLGPDDGALGRHADANWRNGNGAGGVLCANEAK